MPDTTPRPPSPWPGSRYETRLRWQLDLATDLAGAGRRLRALAAELTTAHTAGWWLAEPMRGGHLLAARASRRQRGAQTAPPPAADPRPRTYRWRLRIVDETPSPGQEVFDPGRAPRTPVLVSDGAAFEQLNGPAVPADVLAEVVRQQPPTGPAPRRWGLVAARVGPSRDLVADGSGLRLHAVRGGELVRTHETLTFHHAADGAATLLAAAAAYDRLAWATDAMAAAGGRLAGADDGILHIDYDPPAE